MKPIKIFYFMILLILFFLTYHFFIKQWQILGVILSGIISFLIVFPKKYKHLFCVLVLISLVLPSIYLSKDDMSKQENRNYNKFPDLYTDEGINEKFGIGFNSWFSDRFGGRSFLIDSRFSLLYLLNNRKANINVFMGDNEWIFPTTGATYIPPLADQRRQNLKVIKALKKIDDSMKDKNVQIYVILEPSRSVLYKEYWDNYYPYVPYYDYITDLRTQLKRHKNIHFVDLKDTFEKNKNTIQLYEKNDPHMTLSAVNIMLESIVSALGKNLMDEYKKSIKYEDRSCKLFSFLHYYELMLKINSQQKETTCKEITVKNKHMKILEEEIGYREAVVEKPFINKDLYILFPCYEEFIFPVLGEFFAHTISVNYNSFEEHDKEALKNKVLSKLKSIKPESILLIFLSYPTEYNMSESTVYLEAY